MEYCTKCVYPLNAVNLRIDDGICSSCKTFKKFSNIKNPEWERREKLLESILNEVKTQNSNNYDCLIPVSGGKDSYFQTHTIVKKYGTYNKYKGECKKTQSCKLTTDLRLYNIKNLIDINTDYIKLCIYNIDQTLNIPFVKYFFVKSDNDELDFLKLNYSKSKDILLKILQQLFADFNVKITIVGLLKYENENIVLVNLNGIINNDFNNYIFGTVYEIINCKKIVNNNISQNITNFFINTKCLLYLYNIKEVITPKIIYKKTNESTIRYIVINNIDIKLSNHKL